MPGLEPGENNCIVTIAPEIVHNSGLKTQHLEMLEEFFGDRIGERERAEDGDGMRSSVQSRARACRSRHPKIKTQ